MVSGCDDVFVTRPPTCSRLSPIRPLIGARIVGPQDRASGVRGRFARGHRRVAGLTRGERVVEVLSRRRFFLDQRLEPFHILPGLQQGGLGLCDVRRGLRERATRAFDFRLVRPHVQDVEHLSRTHVRPDVERAPIDVAVHASTDFDEIAGVGAGRILAMGRHVFSLDVQDADLRRRGSGGGRGFSAAGGEQRDGGGGEQDARRPIRSFYDERHEYYL